MGDGFWLDPEKQQAHRVSKHELWVLEPDNARLAGIPPHVYERLKTLNPVKDEDEIRFAAIHAGLIRTRDHGNYISVQFAASPDRVRAFLRSAYLFLSQQSEDKYADLWIDNLANNDSVRIPLDKLGERLLNGEPIMEEAERPITDVPLNAAVEKQRPT